MIRIVPLATSEAPELSFDTVVGADYLGDHILAEEEGDNTDGLATRHHLRTAVILSLFTDRAVEADELRGGDVQRGWPGDALTLVPGAELDPLGSRLWLLRRRALQEDEAVRLAEAWAQEALHWLITDSVAREVTTTAARSATDPNRLDLSVAVRGPAGTLYAARFAVHWRNP